MSTFYLGSNPADASGDAASRFFYAIKSPGLNENDFKEFEYGVDFFDGRLESDHSRPYSNLEYDQYRWGSRNVFYYINDNGEFVVRLNQEYIYPDDAKV
jgi:hypothetical protein